MAESSYGACGAPSCTMAWTATVRVLEAEVERLNADLDHEVREHQVTHERWMEAKDEVERLREALRDAAEYLRLGMTWIEDTDRHGKMKRAWECARERASERPS